jgi:hypothetical protein
MRCADHGPVEESCFASLQCRMLVSRLVVDGSRKEAASGMVRPDEDVWVTTTGEEQERIPRLQDPPP